jgi:hypothetical protein
LSENGVASSTCRRTSYADQVCCDAVDIERIASSGQWKNAIFGIDAHFTEDAKVVENGFSTQEIFTNRQQACNALLTEIARHS